MLEVVTALAGSGAYQALAGSGSRRHVDLTHSAALTNWSPINLRAPKATVSAASARLAWSGWSSHMAAWAVWTRVMTALRRCAVAAESGRARIVKRRYVSRSGFCMDRLQSSDDEETSGGSPNRELI